MQRSVLVLTLVSLLACKKSGPFERMQEDQRKASCPDLTSAAECTARLELQREKIAAAADAGRIAAEEASAAADVAHTAELRMLSREERAARVRAVCRPDGYCRPGFYIPLLHSTDDAGERKAIAAICMKSRNGTVAVLRTELASLRQLVTTARANPGECIDVGEPKARMARLETDVQPLAVHQLRVAVNQVRMCSCTTIKRSSCDDVVTTLKAAEADLAEPQNEYCE